MSPRMLRVLVGVGLVAGAWGLWTWLHSPQRRIHRRLDDLASRLEKGGDESALATAATARGVADFFAPGFIVRARPYEGELRDPQELAGAVYRLRGGARAVEVDISDRQLTLAPDGRSAELLYVATVTLDRGSGPARDRWRVRTLWIEDGGEWKVSELELLQRLEGGGGLGV